MRDVIQEFKDFNRPFASRDGDRSANLMRFKIERMVDNPFAFFRGTYHLFARDVVSGVAEFAGGDGEIDVVGDIHGENFGTFKDGDSVVHYDVNDFDETTRGRPVTDVGRLAVSFFLAAREHPLSVNDAVATVLAGVAAYADRARHAVKKGKADFDVTADQPSGCGPVDQLVAASVSQRRQAFIEGLTESGGKNGRQFRRSKKYFKLPDDEYQRAQRLLADYRTRVTRKPEQPDYYAVADVCGRVSGIGSMGRYRYAVLLKGKSTDGDARNVILEFKEARPSGYDLARGRDGGTAALPERAAAVIAMQRRSQVASNGHLGFAVDGGMSFQVRELGPADDRVDGKALKSAADLQGVAKVQAEILARVHARAGRDAVGPANALSDLSDPDRLSQRMLAFALRYAEQVNQDYDRFRGARAELDDVAAWAK